MNLPGRRATRGFSLVELMISITIGLLVVAALLALYLNVTRSNTEMAQANSQIENGRFAIQLLTGDIEEAGYWGPLAYSTTTPMPAPTASPNVCTAASALSPADKQNLLAIPVQGFADGSSLTICKVSGVLSSSDVIAVTHADTCVPDSATGICAGDSDTGPHIQVSACQAGSPPPEAAWVIEADPTKLILKGKACGAAGTAERRKIDTTVYYLASSGGQPTLMRVTMADGVWLTPQPLVQGIEALHFEYGIDSLGANGNPVSASNPGDGSVDGAYVSCAPCTADQLGNLVAVKIYLVARNLTSTPGYTDSKSYQLGSVAYTVPTADTGYKRHAFSTTIRLVNPSSRRETP
jgi:prepilin-type N-terminal cleavage/methylation domain